MKSKQIYKMVLAAMLAALAFVCFYVPGLRIELPIMAGGSSAKLYVGHTFVLLAGILLGPWYGAAVGALGLGLADILAGYVTSSVPTILAKAVLGLAAGLLARYAFKIDLNNRSGKTVGRVVATSILAVILNVATEPFIRYFYKIWILGYEKAVALASSINCAIAMSLGGAASIVLAALLFKLIQPMFRGKL